MAQILIVDDEPDVAKTIDRGLYRKGFQTIAVHSGVEALKSARRLRPDLIVLDIIMPNMDGLEVCRRLRSDPVLSDIPILFLTAKGKIDDKIEGFKAGADDYLAKPFHLEELSLRVRALLRRSMPRTVTELPTSLQVGDLQLDSRTFEVRVKDRKALLTPVEFDLLYHLMSNAGQVFSSERLLQEVWDFPYDTGSPDLVRMHIRNLRAKVEPDPRQPVYIRTISRHGYTILKPE
ncbi:MAG: response regulator transcription factor [Chloroflexi bacterium]|nr:response regulator transcription factor [Chloroflexota bacterium]